MRSGVIARREAGKSPGRATRASPNLTEFVLVVLFIALSEGAVDRAREAASTIHESGAAFQ
jgi:hypothetical protein